MENTRSELVKFVEEGRIFKYDNRPLFERGLSSIVEVYNGLGVSSLLDKVRKNDQRMSDIAMAQ